MHTERYIKNTTIFPMSQDFHPVYVAAAYLENSRKAVIEHRLRDQHKQGISSCGEKPVLPDMIGGHPWFMFVDPAIDAAQLNFVSSVLEDDYKFLEAWATLTDEQKEAVELAEMQR